MKQKSNRGIFAKQCVEESAMPFAMHLTAHNGRRTLGLADGKYVIPDDIDVCNDEILEIFGVNAM